MTRNPARVLSGYDIRNELVRKLIHITIAAVPLMAGISLRGTELLLVLGIGAYTVSEAARIQGRSIPLVTRLTELAARPGETDFVWGPVTLGLGALASLLFYPHPAATVAVYSLAFGDGIASLVGKAWGGPGWSFLNGKSPAGSLACFLAVFVTSSFVLADPGKAVLVAATATVLESLPLGDADNLAVPLGAGFVASLLLA